jgi:uncharacterized protein YndB with AHSA1/START domain
MPDIRHRVGVNAPQEKVYEALSTIEGLSQWWTRDVRGDAQQGKELEFYFTGDKPGATMRVAELVPSERVVWECVDGPAEWIGTTVTYDLYPGPGQQETVVKFTHADWREPVEFMHHCSTRWAQFLLNLKTGSETGHWQPFPEMPKISSWN